MTGHTCEPDHYPDDLGQRWTCPDCGRRYRSFEVKPEQYAAYMKDAFLPDSYGWLHAPEVG